jgi:hypothetical protein
MARLTDNTWVRNPKTGGMVLLEKGDDVPAWAADDVGEHLLEGGADAELTPYREQKLGDLQAAVAERNEGRSEEDQVKPEKRSIEAFAAALEADDAKQAASSGGDAGDGGSGGDDSGSGS